VTTNTDNRLEVIRRAAEQWMQHDPDPATRAELAALLAKSDLASTDIVDRFTGRLEFGTAGLRGVIGAGPNRMNRAVVARTTLGLARYLKKSGASGGAVVVGYDGRRMSREFADDAASVLAAAGLRAILARGPIPTPLTAFAVKHAHAVAGVMVTASHNPPEYNGYKVYWGNGAQIIPPLDEGIAKEIDLAPPANEVPKMELTEARAKGVVVDMPSEYEEAYLDAVSALAVHATGGTRDLAIVYTPLHGVGDKLAREALSEASFTNVHSVSEQREPDGAFPTVAFPNPEEKGAMDLSFALARSIRADLVLANDPDADRLAVAVPAPGKSASGFVQLTGNQVGVLLGHYVLTERKIEGTPLVIASIVSSPLLGHIARKLGARYEETLTGFKWIANRAMEIERAEPNVKFVFGYEEALGYTVGDVVRDKDGVSAAMLAAEMTAVLASRGRDLLAELDEIARRYGLFVSSQVNVTRKGASGAKEIAEMMDRLRAARHDRIGGHAVVAVSDYEARVKRLMNDGASTALTLPPSNVLAFDLEGGSRIIARPSGTEPKVKFYFDVREEVRAGEPVSATEARANAAMKALADAFVALT
jgi:phosphomannomutase